MLYPAIEPRKSGYLQVDDIHQMYYEECGHPDGVPVVFLHGGPGAGCQVSHRQFFDPKFYRIILFDQRGAGRSKPFAETRNNTVADLIEDMEKLREHLGVEKWLVFGGSWGSTLALAYGEAHPKRCLGFILRGVFLMRDREIEWYLEGVRYFRPECWQAFTQALNAFNARDILERLQHIFTQESEAEQLRIARLYTAYETELAVLMPEKTMPHLTESILSLAKFELHYFIHNQHEILHLLNDITRIVHLPCTIVQGRYDLICPPITAYEVHQAWPGSKLVMVGDAGHSGSEPGIADELVKATNDFKALLSLK